MTYSTFQTLFQLACLSRDFNEFADSAKEHDPDGYLANRGILYSLWLFSVDHSSTKVRELSGLSRAAFCRQFGLQERTVANWDMKKTYPTDWALNLLCYAVLQDVLES